MTEQLYTEAYRLYHRLLDVGMAESRTSSVARIHKLNRVIRKASQRFFRRMNRWQWEKTERNR